MGSRDLVLAVLVAALPSSAGAATFCNTSPITIPTSGQASPYPSSISVSGLATTTTAWVEIKINGFSHTFANDVGMVLVAPDGAAFAVQDGAGDLASLSDVTYTIADNGATQLPQAGAWAAGRFRPANYFNDNFPAPGPGTLYGNPGPIAGGTATFATVYSGLLTDLNGTWNLFVFDFVGGDGGSIAGGWCLTVLRPRPPKGDLNADQTSDLMLQQLSNPGHNEAWLMNGPVRIGSQAAITPDAAATQQLRGSDQFVLATASNDLVFWDSLTGAVEFWSMNGVTRAGAAIPLTGATPLPLNWQLVATGDLSGDNKPDLLWRNSTSQNLVIWVMDGTVKTGVMTPNPPQAVHANWRVVAVLDYNADGHRDLLWYNDTSGKIVVWEMDENVSRIAGLFTNPTAAGNSNWKVVAGGDYGTAVGGAPFLNDVVWRNDTSGKLVVWQMDDALNRVGAGLFTTPDAPGPPLDWNVVGPR